jgi:Ca-activated chloride channel family protein
VASPLQILPTVLKEMRFLFPLFLLPFQLFAAVPPAALPDPVLWPEEQRAFFQDGPGLLLTDAQRDSFLSQDEAGRDAFIRQWLDRDPIPETPENELRLGIERRRRLGLLAFGTSTDIRFKLLFQRGLPAARRVVSCRVLKPLEIWSYEAPDPLRLLIYRPSSAAPFRLWLPVYSNRDLYAGGARRLSAADLKACPEAAEVESIAGAIMFSVKADRLLKLSLVTDLAAWAREAAATPLPPEPERLATGPLELDFPRRQKDNLAVRVLVPVLSRAASVSILSIVEYQERAIGRWSRYHVPAGQRAPLFLELGLPPDLSCVLRLRIRDDESGAETWLTNGFHTPPQPASRLGEAVRTAVWGEPVDLGERVGPDSLLLPPPPEKAVLGVWRVEPLVTGDNIVKVIFLVDGQAQASLSRRPFAAELHFSQVERAPVVRAEGYDENGELVAFDEVTLHRRDAAGDTFGVKLVEPAPGSGAGSGTVRARAEVAVPAGRRIESLEMRLNDKPVATLTAPPWEARVDVPAREEIVFLSAVARLDDGRQAEDTRFLRAPENLEQMNVRLVELSTRVTNRAGHLVPDLKANDFEILEDGKPQALARFELFKNLRLNLGLVVDTSGSMLPSLAEAQRAAAGFLRRVLGPQDRSFAIGFASRPYLLLAPDTGDGTRGASGSVAESLPVPRAYGGTALYDAVATALYELRSGQGQRALVLLSDGGDTASFTTFQQVLELAQRGGVTIYAVGFGSPPVIEQPHVTAENLGSRPKPIPEGPLSRLAEATGGRFYLITRAKELEGVYGRIEEDLRGRYLLAYQTERGDDGESPAVEVRVKKRGLKARTTTGYTP